MSAEGSLFIFLADPSMSISLLADQSVMCSSEMLKPLQQSGIRCGIGNAAHLGVGLLTPRKAAIIISAAHKRLENFQPQYSNPNEVCKKY